MSLLGIDGIDDEVEIGRGAAGVVYRARQSGLGRTVAVKVLAATLGDADIRRFDRECAIVGSLSDVAGIVDVYFSGRTPSGSPFLVMRYLAGGSLADRLDDGALPPADVAAIGVRLATALGGAHGANVLHRDIKPANTLFDSSGTAFLGDFGIASFVESVTAGLHSGTTAYTPAFAAPELFDDAPPTAACDVYSLAATLHAACTGRAPFAGETGGYAAMVRRILFEPAPSLVEMGIPDRLARVVDAGLAKEPADRPALAELAQELAAAAATTADSDLSTRVVEPTPPPGPQSPPPPTPTPPSSRPRPAAPTDPAPTTADRTPPTGIPPAPPPATVPDPGARPGRRRAGLGVVLAAVAALAALVAAIVVSGSDSEPDEVGDDRSEVAGNAGADTASETLLDDRIPCAGQHDGVVVRIASSAPAETATGFDPLRECTGVEVDWETADDDAIQAAVESGDADVAEFPVAGNLRRAVADGHVTPLSGDVATDVAESFVDGAAPEGDGAVLAVPGPTRLNSLVWFSPAEFADAGYEIPTTLEEMRRLSDRIAADGRTPWCVGSEAGTATGFVVTDWIEEFVLRRQGPGIYEQWVAHEIPFDDPRIVDAVDAAGRYVKNPDYLGGTDAVAAVNAIPFGEAGLPLLDGECLMHRQADFYESFWPDGTAIGPGGDVDVFRFPDATDTASARVSITSFAATNDDPATTDVLRYLASAPFQGHLADVTGALSSRRDVDPEALGSAFARQRQELLVANDVVRLDASDRMPPAVGAGSFWAEATRWVAGASTREFVEAVEASWPT